MSKQCASKKDTLFHIVIVLQELSMLKQSIIRIPYGINYGSSKKTTNKKQENLIVCSVGIAFSNRSIPPPLLMTTLSTPLQWINTNKLLNGKLTTVMFPFQSYCNVASYI